MFMFLFAIFFIFLLLVFLLGFSLFRTLKNLFFGGGASVRGANGQRRQATQSSGHRSATTVNAEPRQGQNRRRKIFTEEDGEYVDYEEVK